MKHLISLLAFSFLIGCDGEKSNEPTNPNLEYKIEGDTVTITRCKKRASGELIIPSVIEGNPVTSIGDWAFNGCRALTSITIPDDVSSIGERAFFNCTSLTSISIPDGVTSIGESGFLACRSLTSITIPDSVTSIGDWAFSGCGLTRITIPDSVTSIWRSAFYGCTSLTTIEVGAANVNYTDVNGVLFNKEKTLLHTYPADKTGDNYVIPDGVTSIGDWAFRRCTSLTSITIPDGVTSIGKNAFDKTRISYDYTDNRLNYLFSRSGQIAYLIDGSNASGSVIIPTSVNGAQIKLIADDAFNRCTNLTSITIPDGVTSIGLRSFFRCTNLTSITIGDGVTSIGRSAFGGCKSLTSITIPNSVTNIGIAAFGNCDSLTSITIPDGVTSIGDNAFGSCRSLTKITISNGVTSIGEKAFWNCTSLSAITFLGDIPKIEDNAFEKSSPTIYRKPDAKGWGDTLAGRPVKLITEKP
ncbi:leucine-rich repeat domain-containing protein [Akkermansiaceae bacterium]|nr:leucine-rich repeat domain-containing protein [Akkermansiaceae bacterium]